MIMNCQLGFTIFVNALFRIDIDVWVMCTVDICD